jgi:hypothetical protein
LSIVRIKYKHIKSRRFGSWFFFRLQVKGGEAPTHMGPLDRANLNHWIFQVGPSDRANLNHWTFQMGPLDRDNLKYWTFQMDPLNRANLNHWTTSVQKTISSRCYIPSSEPFRLHGIRSQKTVSFRIHCLENSGISIKCI